jgi:hypothetical protein
MNKTILATLTCAIGVSATKLDSSTKIEGLFDNFIDYDKMARERSNFHANRASKAAEEKQRDLVRQRKWEANLKIQEEKAA